MSKSDTIGVVNRLRETIGVVDRETLKVKDSLCTLTDLPASDRGEAMACVTIAHRNLEDARMRLGKVIQAIEGGKSILDHPRIKALIEEIRREK